MKPKPTDKFYSFFNREQLTHLPFRWRKRTWRCTTRSCRACRSSSPTSTSSRSSRSSSLASVTPWQQRQIRRRRQHWRPQQHWLRRRRRQRWQCRRWRRRRCRRWRRRQTTRCRVSTHTWRSFSSGGSIGSKSRVSSTPKSWTASETCRLWPKRFARSFEIETRQQNKDVVGLIV